MHYQSYRFNHTCIKLVQIVWIISLTIITQWLWNNNHRINMNYNNSYIKLLLSSTIMNLMSSSIEYSTDLINQSIIQYVLQLTIIKNSIKKCIIIHKINHNNIINELWDEWCENGLKQRRSTNLGVFFSSPPPTKPTSTMIRMMVTSPNTSIYTRVQLKWGVFW